MRRLYIPSPHKCEMIKDGDYLYSYELRKLAAYADGLDLTLGNSLLMDISTYPLLALAFLRRRCKLNIPRHLTWHLSQFYKLSPFDSGLREADAVLAYERYPANADLPVIWITGPTDIAKLKARGLPEREIEREIEFKREANARAAATVLTSHAKKAAFDEVILPTKPTEVIPFFQPVAAATDGTFKAKWKDTGQIKLLFIGHGAVRKGLPLVIDAFMRLRSLYQGRVSLHVVSRLADGPVAIPSCPEIYYEREVSHARAVELICGAHYLLMPSTLESYGWVYIEAMAQGTIPVATEHPVQRELFDDGRCGLLVDRSVESIVQALRGGFEFPEGALQMASHARAWWRAQYSPYAVAEKFSMLAHRISAVNRREVQWAEPAHYEAAT